LDIDSNGKQKLISELIMEAFKTGALSRGSPSVRSSAVTPMFTVPLRIHINSAPHDVSIEPWTTLLDALRELSASPERKRDATMANAAPARCWSMAGGCFPAAIAALPKGRRYVRPPFAPDRNALTL
jgi:hypothetical protein